jgi:hypothetical protein
MENIFKKIKARQSVNYMNYEHRIVNSLLPKKENALLKSYENDNKITAKTKIPTRKR